MNYICNICNFLFNICNLLFSFSQYRECMGQSWAKTYFSYWMNSYTHRIAVFNNLFALTCSQPKGKQNHVCGFLLFKYFLNNLLLTFFMQNTLSKFVEILQQKMYDIMLEKRGYVFQNRVRNVCANIKVNRLNRFRTGARHVFTTQEPFPSEIPLTMKTAILNSLNTFHYLITICQISFKIYTSLKSNKSYPHPKT